MPPPSSLEKFFFKGFLFDWNQSWNEGREKHGMKEEKNIQNLSFWRRTFKQAPAGSATLPVSRVADPVYF